MRSVWRTLSTWTMTLSTCATCVAYRLFEAFNLPSRVFCAFRVSFACPSLLLSIAPRGAFHRCMCFVWSLQAKLCRMVCMIALASLKGYTFTQERGVKMPQMGAWTLIRTKSAKSHRV